MSYLAWYVCVCVLVTRMCPAKTAEPIEMPLGERPPHMGTRNHVVEFDESIRSREKQEVGDVAFRHILCYFYLPMCDALNYQAAYSIRQ